MTDWREAALIAFVRRFPGDYKDRMRADGPLYLAAMGRITPEQWPAVADRMRLDSNFLPSPGDFSRAIETAVSQGVRERVVAKWAMSEIHTAPHLARYIVRDWLVDRTAWPPVALEPDSDGWPFPEAREAEFNRAVDRMERGNLRDETKAELPIARQRFLALAEALGRRQEADRALVACERATRPVDRGSLQGLAEKYRRQGKPIPAPLARAIA